MRSILGIDTASPQGSVALWLDGSPRGVIALPPGGHSSGLALAAERLCRDVGLSLADLSGLAVARGPGSFTGLRIGLAWAKGVAMGAEIPLALVSSHEAAAFAATASGVTTADRLLVTITPGERREIEIAIWESAPGARARPLAVREPESVPEDDLAERVEALSAGRLSLALPSNEAIATLLAEDEVPHAAPALLAPAVAALGALLLEAGEAADLALAAPAYGRAPNARKPTP